LTNGKGRKRRGIGNIARGDVAPVTKERLHVFVERVDKGCKH
jgi:hypothetical protein